MKYFIIVNEKKKGPLSLTQVKEYKLERKTLIWKEGLEDWQPAESLEEFKELVISKPPPIPIYNVNDNPKIDIKKKSKSLVALFFTSLFYGIVISSLFTFVYSEINKPDYLSQEQIKEARDYINANITAEVLPIGQYVPTSKYAVNVTRDNIASGRINTNMKILYHSDLKSKFILVTIIAFGIIFTGYYFYIVSKKQN